MSVKSGRHVHFVEASMDRGANETDSRLAIDSREFCGESFGNGKWSVVLRMGVPEKEAKALYNALISAEREVPEERLAMLDRYEPVRR